MHGGKRGLSLRFHIAPHRFHPMEKNKKRHASSSRRLLKTE
jgi:hypothetical protein